MTKIHSSFWLRLFNLTRCIDQISHYNQLDWSKNTCFGPLIKMDMSISRKWPIGQLEPFKKPCFVVVNFIVLGKNIVCFGKIILQTLEIILYVLKQQFYNTWKQYCLSWDNSFIILGNLSQHCCWFLPSLIALDFQIIF